MFAHAMSPSAFLGMHAASVPCWQRYIHQHDHGAYDYGIDSTVNHNPTRQFEKSCPSHLEWLCSVTQNSGEFLLCRILPDAICRHPSSSCFFLHHWIAIKNFAWASVFWPSHAGFPIVQSTTTSITTCALWHCLHTVPHSLAVVPIKKLLSTATVRVMVMHTPSPCG